MALKVHCPNPDCGQKYNFDESHLGRQVACRKCGLEFRLSAGPEETLPGTQAVETAPPKARPLPQDLPGKIGRFEIRARLGAGAFGIVCRAYDPTLDREVALKVPHAGKLDTEKAKTRFLREAKAAARLRHPNIVPVYEAGREGDAYYIASAFIEGKTLQAALDEEPFDFQKSARLIRDLAGALYYAHRLGIVHRDVKPSNIMLDGNGDPLLMDFGLARFQEGAEKLTHDGTLLGTPAYMPPEQAVGKLDEVGPASDQYSLGVVFYELLCGEVPFSGPPALVISHVINSEPPRLRSGYPERKIPLDLETICLKAMSKRAGERYGSCAELAEDLRRWQSGEPVFARRIGLPERLWRCCRRNPGIATLSAIAIVLLLLVALVANVGYVRTSRALSAEANARQKVQEAFQLEQETSEKLRWTLYTNRIQLADRHWEQGAISRAESLLQECPQAFRGWEWNRMSWLCRAGEWHVGPLEGIRDAAWNPNGKQLVVATNDDTLAIWDLVLGKKTRTLAADDCKDCSNLTWRHDGQQVAAHTASGVCVWDCESGSKKNTLDGELMGVWSPDGELFATAKNTVLSIWDLKANSRLQTRPAGQGGITGLAWSPDSTRIVSCSHDTGVKIWDARTLKFIRSFRGHHKAVTCVAWSPDGRRLATGGYETLIRIWSSDTGEKLATLRGHTSTPWCAAWSADNRHLATAGDDCVVKIWDVEEGCEITTLRGHRSRIYNMAWSPDGQWLASTGGGVRVWNPRTSGYARALTAGGFGVNAISWHPDGQRLALSCLWDCRVWNTMTPEQSTLIHGAHQAKFNWQAAVTSVAYSHDGKFVATGGTDKMSKIWDASNGSLRHALSGHADSVHCVAWSIDDRQLATGSADGKVKIWDVEQGREQRTLAGHVGAVRAVSWSPDGALLASGADDSTLRLWDLRTGRQVFADGKQNNAVISLSWSPDGKLLAAGTQKGLISVWDPRSGKLEREFQVVQDNAIVAWHPSQRRLAVGGGNGTLRICDTLTGDEILSLRGHDFIVLAVAWSPDGQQLASSDYVGEVRIWDSRNRDQLPWPGFLPAREP